VCGWERERVCVCIRAIGQFKATSLHANGKKKKKKKRGRRRKENHCK
jgi:hypothetical protein